MNPDHNSTTPGDVNSIHLLPTELAHRIAAGEVIERPASILKELLENSLDAGATVLQIELTKGGCASLRIADNGGGMEAADVPRAFQRHATSKLAVFDDLYRLRTFGFRGEALPSIAAVARVELTTRMRDALAGTAITVENCEVQEIREVGCPTGTTIHVSRIFDAVPVRKKFLKSEATEQGACLETINRIALAASGVKIRVLSNGRPLWDMPATADVRERIAMVLGRGAGRGLLRIKGIRGDMSLAGHISRPEVSRANTKDIYCFVNGRYIRDALLNHAIMTACRNVMEAKRYPAAVLFLTMSPEDVDVNVHPAKLEVRFRNPRAVYGLVVEAILAGFAAVGPSSEAGTAPDPVPAASLVPGSGDESARVTDAPGGAILSSQVYQRRLGEALKRYTLLSGAKKTSFRPGTSIFTSGGARFGHRDASLPGTKKDQPVFAGPGNGTNEERLPPHTHPEGRDRGETGAAREASYLTGGIGTSSWREDAHSGTAVGRGRERMGEPGPFPRPTAAEDAIPDRGEGTQGSRKPATPLFPSSGDGDRQRRLFAAMTYLGQTGGCYLVFSDHDELVLMDQHAAHERILYEEFRRGDRGGQAVVQPLLLPEVATLSPGDYGLLMEHRELLQEAGMDIEPFGGHTVAIRSLPAVLGRLDPRTLLEEFLARLAETAGAASWEEKRDKALISLACQGAVKAGQVLSEPEVVRLCQDLDRLPFAGTCPHGRPVWIVLTARQLAGLFRRT